MFFIVALIIIIFIIVYAVEKNSGGSVDWPSHESEQKAAGRLGEKSATRVIERHLNYDDVLLTNVKISYDNRPAELDNLIINKNGVFIIEVKYYVGKLYGSEDDYEWKKYKESYEETFVKTVKNPIRQVRRQVDILARYLRNNGISVWVEGYAYLLESNSPVKSEYIISSPNEIDKIIHSPGKKPLSPSTINKITALLNKGGTV